MKTFRLSVIAISIAAVLGCSGEGSSSAITKDKAQAKAKAINAVYEAEVIDEQLQDALVWLDVNSNYEHDMGEPSAYTNIEGKAILDVSEISSKPQEYSLIALAQENRTIKKNSGEKIAKSYLMVAPSGVQTITPIAHLVHSKQKTEGIAFDQATSNVADLIGSVSQQVLHDYLAKNTDKNLQALSLGITEVMPDAKKPLTHQIIVDSHPELEEAVIAFKKSDITTKASVSSDENINKSTTTSLESTEKSPSIKGGTTDGGVVRQTPKNEGVDPDDIKISKVNRQNTLHPDIEPQVPNAVAETENNDGQQAPTGTDENASSVKPDGESQTNSDTDVTPKTSIGDSESLPSTPDNAVEDSGTVVEPENNGGQPTPIETGGDVVPEQPEGESQNNGETDVTQTDSVDGTEPLSSTPDNPVEDSGTVVEPENNGGQQTPIETGGDVVPEQPEVESQANGEAGVNQANNIDDLESLSSSPDNSVEDSGTVAEVENNDAQPTPTGTDENATLEQAEGGGDVDVIQTGPINIAEPSSKTQDNAVQDVGSAVELENNDGWSTPIGTVESATQQQTEGESQAKGEADLIQTDNIDDAESQSSTPGNEVQELGSVAETENNDGQPTPIETGGDVVPEQSEGEAQTNGDTDVIPTDHIDGAEPSSKTPDNAVEDSGTVVEPENNGGQQTPIGTDESATPEQPEGEAQNNGDVDVTQTTSIGDSESLPSTPDNSVEDSGTAVEAESNGGQPTPIETAENTTLEQAEGESQVSGDADVIPTDNINGAESQSSAPDHAVGDSGTVLESDNNDAQPTPTGTDGTATPQKSEVESQTNGDVDVIQTDPINIAEPLSSTPDNTNQESVPDEVGHSGTPNGDETNEVADPNEDSQTVVEVKPKGDELAVSGGSNNVTPANPQPSINFVSQIDSVKADLSSDSNTVLKLANYYLFYLQVGGNWQDINYYSGLYRQYPATEHLERIKTLAAAFHLTKDREYKDKALKALAYWIKITPVMSEWWQNVGKGQVLAEVALLLGDVLPDDDKSYVIKLLPSSINLQGARIEDIDYAENVIYHGLLIENEALVQEGLKAIELILENLVINGVKTDWQAVLNKKFESEKTGLDYFNSAVSWAHRVDDLSWKFGEVAVNNLASMLLDGIRWISRVNQLNESLSFNKDSVFQSESTNNKSSLVPTLATINKLVDLYPERRQDVDNYGSSLYKGLLSEISRFEHFGQQDYTESATDDFLFRVRMKSNRTVSTPTQEEQYLPGFWASMGSTFLTLSGEEYRNILPVFDWTKVPGVTSPKYIPTDDSLSDVLQGSSFVGGVSDGHVGVSTMVMQVAIPQRFVAIEELQRFGGGTITGGKYIGGTTRAQKSWFSFGEQIVALGKGISSTHSDVPVTTSLNQTSLNGDVTGGNRYGYGPIPNTGASYYNVDQWDWIHHDSVGYIFLDSIPRIMLMNRQSGTWSNIEPNTSDYQIEKDVFTLFTYHGYKPNNSGYQYVVVPNKTAAEVDWYRRNLPVRILANTDQIQAAADIDKDVVGAVFFEAGELDAAVYHPNYSNYKIKVDSPCVVLLDNSSGEMNISISTPGQAYGVVDLTVSRDGYYPVTKRVVTPGREDLIGSSVSFVLSDGQDQTAIDSLAREALNNKSYQ